MSLVWRRRFGSRFLARLGKRRRIVPYSCLRVRRIIFEGLEDRRLLAADFGDAPLPYPTTLAEGGAAHEATGPTLGATRDSEADGRHSPAADADGADEDGVTFGPIAVGALGATVTVHVQGGAARLDAWIDFDADGSWGGPGEQIFDRLAVAAGENNLTFDVPSWAASGTTIARFRLSTEGDLAIGGSASDGEVEDYQITLLPPAETRGAFRYARGLTSGANRVTSVFAADVDGDGDMDVLSASSGDDRIAWYENDGDANFTPHTITDAADGANSVFAIDLDGDGDMDVLSASSWDDTIAWYENDGNQRFTPHTIARDAKGARSVTAADVDGDGDMDVLSASRFDDTIAWYENDGSGNFAPHTITSEADCAQSVAAADVDGDGDMDVLSASSRDGTVAWYENNGSQVFTRRTIDTAANWVRSVQPVDVDGDGDMDVLSASPSGNKITWYENGGENNFTPRPIASGATGADRAIAADMDGDGDWDVLGITYADNRLRWYENDGSGGFTLRADMRVGRPETVVAADLVGGGDLDIGSRSGYKNVKN
ncbi:MAG: FG-GAP repeat domain-containing protein, partial [Pirellulales bacterium]